MLSIYDIATNTWATGALMPSGQGRINACSGIVNGVIYLIGGTTNSLDTTNVLAYTISTNTWTVFYNTPLISSTAIPLIYVGSETYNNKIYVVGGQNKTGTYNPYENQLWVLDVNAKTWTRGIGMPTGRISPAVSVFDKKLFVSGGETTIINDSMRLEICVLG
jgi:N-acetylneuraminic acid mutarotase